MSGHTAIINSVDSDGVGVVRLTKNGSAVNNVYLSSSETRFTKPVAVGSGGVPTNGTEGQILTKGATDAEWRDPVLNKANTYLLTGGTAIPSNADLNDYNQIGNYYCALNATAETLTNCPTTHAFTLKVSHGTGEGYSQQELVIYDTGKRYTRTFSEGSWHQWYNTFQTGDILAPEYGGVPINSGFNILNCTFRYNLRFRRSGINFEISR